MNEKILFTSESVSEGHPDKICDQVSDAILDAVLAQDPNSFVACECYATTNLLIIGGEITTTAKVDYEEVARSVIRDIGYDDDEIGFNYKTVKIINLIKEQSNNIRQGIVKDNYENQGAGDQGIMFGYASNETKGYMPLAISIAHKLVREATRLRKENKLPNALPDMKSQVTIDYTNKTPRIETILMSVQHKKGTDLNKFKEEVYQKVMVPVVKSFGLNLDFKVLFNPTGKFEIGGPKGDTGLTGRKIIVDTYGGSARHGGGAFSGKDPSKVDRSAAYMARYIAKNIVASGAARKCEIQLAYAIGVAKPVSVMADTFGTGITDDQRLAEAVSSLVDMRPAAIIERFDLRRPIYADLAAYGHMGREDLNAPWERRDLAQDLKKVL